MKRRVRRAHQAMVRIAAPFCGEVFLAAVFRNKMAALAVIIRELRDCDIPLLRLFQDCFACGFAGEFRHFGKLREHPLDFPDSLLLRHIAEFHAMPLCLASA